MLDHPLTEPLRSGEDAAWYDPESAVTYLPGRPVTAARGAHAVEQQHEAIHWIQQVATPFGEFQSALKRARHGAAIQYLRSLPELTERLRERLRPGGRPVFDVARYGATRSEAQGVFRDTDAASRAWAERYFLAFQAELCWYAKGYPAGVAEPRLIFFAQLLLMDPELRKDDRAAAAARFLAGEADAVEDGRIVSTRDLLESAAFALEAGMHANYETHEYDVADRVKRLLGTPYFSAQRIAARLWHVDIAHWSDLTAALLTCIDIALAPPLPPRDPVVGQPWWAIYPPTRFVRAVRAVDGLGWSRSLRDVALWTDPETRGRIAKAAGLRVAARAGKLDMPLRSAFADWVKAGDAVAIEEDRPEDLDFHTLMALCQDHAATLQREHGVGWHMDKAFAATGGSNYFTSGTPGDLKRFFVLYAPFVVTARSTYAEAANWPTRLPAALIWTRLETYGLNDLLLRVGPPRLMPRVFGTDSELASAARELFCNAIIRLLGVEPPLD